MVSRVTSEVGVVSSNLAGRYHLFFTGPEVRGRELPKFDANRRTMERRTPCAIRMKACLGGREGDGTGDHGLSRTSHRVELCLLRIALSSSIDYTW